ncbi:hypothetical protein P2318_01905 [Myxococcaceae bacterium GXIMD 01537]
MKPPAALLAGLLAGLALSGVSWAQPAALPLAPTVLAVAGDEEEAPPVENPMKGTDPKKARCAMDCQAPAFECAKRCGSYSSNDCTDGCGQRLLSCMEKCGVDMKKLQGVGEP